MSSTTAYTDIEGAKIQAVLFDLDGTLIDSAPGLSAAANRMREQRAMPALALSTYRVAASSGARGLLKVAFDIDPDSANYANYCQEFLDNYASLLLNDIAVFDGIDSVLQDLLQRGVPWGIVTNKATRFTSPIVGHLPELRSAAVVISGDTTPHAKPHPAPLLEAANRLGISAERCLYIGDDKRDIDAAHAAGMHSMAALWGYLGSHCVESWNANVHVEHPQDILHWLQQQD